MRASRKCVALSIAVGSLALWPAGAGAAPVDATPDHAAIAAYNRYLQASLVGLPAARAHDDAYIASISKLCPDALAAVNLLPASAINRAAAVAFGEEVGADLLVATWQPDHVPFATLRATLARLPWSSPQTGPTITRFLKAQHKVFRLPASHLCADAEDFAASNGQRTPPATLWWLAKFGRAVSGEQTQLAAFIKTLERFEAPEDAGLVGTEQRLFRKLGASAQSLVVAEATKLVSVLGLST